MVKYISTQEVNAWLWLLRSRSLLCSVNLH
jgi:hypothetical protein